MKPTKKSINKHLPRFDALRREYRTFGQYGICPNRTFSRAFADIAENGSVTRIVTYAIGDAMESRHYYDSDDTVDITEQIEAAIQAKDYYDYDYGRDSKAFRAAIIDSIQDAIITATETVE